MWCGSAPWRGVFGWSDGGEQCPGCTTQRVGSNADDRAQIRPGTRRVPPSNQLAITTNAGEPLYRRYSHAGRRPNPDGDATAVDLEEESIAIAKLMAWARDNDWSVLESRTEMTDVP
jgi:hypothetical protein